MYEALLVIFLIVAIALVALIMLQQGKGYRGGGIGRHATLRW
ncbi:MAG: preprotein translocase subunit SecG [Enterobacter sp.]|nr:preprotein translocase subunit SecG [Enterobacter sp.]MDU5077324.1 preprotein translocase subunit SecG [Enterobacter sp.]